MENELKNLYKELDNLNEKYFKEYVGEDAKTADYFLILGKSSGVGEAMDLLKKLMTENNIL